MDKNKAFFKDKTYAQILREINFDNHLTNLVKKLSNKKIGIYGAGTMLDFMIDNFNFSGFKNVVIIDKKFEKKNETYKNYTSCYSPQELSNLNLDAILISLPYPIAVYKQIKKCYKNKKTPKIFFLVNKPLTLFIEEIFAFD